MLSLQSLRVTAYALREVAVSSGGHRDAVVIADYSQNRKEYLNWDYGNFEIF